MASTKSGGTASNLNDSNPKYLGTKLYGGETAKVGSIIVRQRGTRIIPGRNVGMGKDHTLFSLVEGRVLFANKRKTNYDGQKVVRPTVSVTPFSVAPVKKAASVKPVAKKETAQKISSEKTVKKTVTAK